MVILQVCFGLEKDAKMPVEPLDFDRSGVICIDRRKRVRFELTIYFFALPGIVRLGERIRISL